jgi:hypothetical protein
MLCMRMRCGSAKVLAKRDASGIICILMSKASMHTRWEQFAYIYWEKRGYNVDVNLIYTVPYSLNMMGSLLLIKLLFLLNC